MPRSLTGTTPTVTAFKPSAATALARGAAGLVLLSALAALPTAAHGQSFDTVATWNRIRSSRSSSRAPTRPRCSSIGRWRS